MCSDCEPVHICPAWGLLSSRCWGFQGPSDRRRRDTTFRARRRSFFVSWLALPGPDIDIAKPFWRTDETVFWDGEGVLKSKPAIEDPDQQWGSIMSAFTIGLVYGPSCEKYLVDLARHLLELSKKPAA